MKSVLDKTAREELINRIQSLNENNKARWGKMNVYQMVRHCVLCEELFLGKMKHKRSLMGRLFGKIGLKNILAEGKSFPQSAPTTNAVKVKEPTGDMAAEKQKWIALLDEYKNYPDEYVHWFFGKMTREQVGWFVYKHNDHHLRQFGA
jgi:uncharacterized damage-inducible protein DinB